MATLHAKGNCRSTRTSGTRCARHRLHRRLVEETRVGKYTAVVPTLGGQHGSRARRRTSWIPTIHSLKASLSATSVGATHETSRLRCAYLLGAVRSARNSPLRKRKSIESSPPTTRRDRPAARLRRARGPPCSMSTATAWRSSSGPFPSRRRRCSTSARCRRNSSRPPSCCWRSAAKLSLDDDVRKHIPSSPHIRHRSRSVTCCTTRAGCAICSSSMVLAGKDIKHALRHGRVHRASCPSEGAQLSPGKRLPLQQQWLPAPRRCGFSARAGCRCASSRSRTSSAR